VTPNDKEKIIAKIRKLLALTQSNFSGEAESAMLKAQQLLMEYNLGMHDVSDIDETIDVIELTLQYHTPPWWYKYLIAAIAENFRCEVLEESFYMSYRKVYFLIGREHDARVAKDVFLYAVNLIDYNGKPFRDLGATHENAYIKGFLSGLMAKFAEQVKENQWGLILVKDPEIVEAKEKHNPLAPQKTPLPKTAKDFVAWDSGFIDGKTLDHAQKRIEETKKTRDLL
jgi:hypothetical protein